MPDPLEHAAEGGGTGPACWSEMTSSTPCSPRCFRVRRNPRQTPHPRSRRRPTRGFRPPSAVTAVATTTAIKVTCPAANRYA